MKLIIVGATGLVGTELLRQSLLRTDITAVLAVTRRALSSPSPKFQNVIVKDYDQCGASAIEALKDADGCIWTIALTPSKAAAYPWPEVLRICQTSTLTFLRAISSARTTPPAHPFRFIYMSGTAAERDQTVTPSWKPQYSLMRGETENQVLAFAAEHGIEAAVAKPGFIKDNGWAKRAFSVGLGLMGVPSIGLRDVAGAMLERVVKGWESEPWQNGDMVEEAKRLEREGRAV
ncbi:hypothetical protein BU23DRAFT_47896 [Bimuria novae-zelandiae CBS 107.79]|uniref:NAD(P)-binding domain-containing protein n=1 Tax=Bimuria novae-zelandiae CBS 107.79 TaxID=1447943 RepID=A0A6A5VGU5_9PLEO|nr:hypothetical protein BU23DRAFT_47896 [Bimuria novae-zelandiae CBS 107.79]